MAAGAIDVIIRAGSVSDEQPKDKYPRLLESPRLCCASSAAPAPLVSSCSSATPGVSAPTTAFRLESGRRAAVARPFPEGWGVRGRVIAAASHHASTCVLARLRAVLKAEQLPMILARDA